MRMSKKSAKALVLFAGLMSSAPVAISTAVAAPPPKADISEDASTAVAQMGKSLQAEQFSFQARILRVYPGPSGLPLHIAHSMKVTVHRPDHLMVDVTGDDGSLKMLYDGKTATLYGAEANKYATIPAPPTIQGLLDMLSEQLNVDFPLADLLSGDPEKSALAGVAYGKQVDTVTIDGVPCRYLVFAQTPGVEVELWVEKNDRSLPRRLIITYRTMPGHPSVIAELSDWKFTDQPSDADFVFQPPKDATQVTLDSAKAGATTKEKGTKP